MKKLSHFLCALVILVLARCSDDTERADPADARAVTASQQNQDMHARGKPIAYPSYNTSPLPPNQTGMTSNAVQLAAQIKLGWNIGNSLEAIGGETAWGNPQVTKA